MHRVGLVNSRVEHVDIAALIDGKTNCLNAPAIALGFFLRLNPFDCLFAQTNCQLSDKLVFSTRNGYRRTVVLQGARLITVSCSFLFYAFIYFLFYLSKFYL